MKTKKLIALMLSLSMIISVISSGSVLAHAESSSLEKVSGVSGIVSGETYVLVMDGIGPTGMSWGSYALSASEKSDNVLNFCAYSSNMELTGYRWVISSSGSGYTLMAKDGANKGKYLDVGEGTIKFSDSPVVLSLTGSSTIQIKNASNSSYRVRFSNSAEGCPGFVSGTSGSSADFAVYHEKSTSEEPDPGEYDDVVLEKVKSMGDIYNDGVYILVMDNIALSNSGTVPQSSYAMKSISLSSRVLGIEEYKSGMNYSGCLWVLSSADILTSSYTFKAYGGENDGKYLSITSNGLSLSNEPCKLKLGGGFNISADIDGSTYYVRFSNSVDNCSGFVAQARSESSTFTLYHVVGTGVVPGDEEYEEMDPPTTEPLLTIGCISDLHIDYGIENWEVPMREGTIKTCNELRKEGLDVLLVGGDITSHNNSGGISKNRFSFVKETVKNTTKLAVESGRVLYATGNHEYAQGGTEYNSGDYSDIMLEDVGEFVNAYYYDEDHKFLLAYHYVIDGFHFLVLNTPFNGGDNHGSYNYTTGSVDWIGEELSKIGKDQTVFVMSHYPFRDSNGVSSSGKGMAEPYNTQLKNILLQYPNVIYLYGHDHGGPYIDKDVMERITPYMADGTPLTTRSISPTGFVSSFMGSMSFYYQSWLADWQPEVVQALIVRVYDDRVVFETKNYGAKSGAALNPKAYTIARSITPDERVFTPADPDDYGVDPTNYYVAPTSVKADAKDITIEPNDLARLTVTLDPETAGGRMTWVSSDEAIVTVSDKGVITGVTKGEAIVTVTTINGLKATFNVTVKDFDPGDVNADGKIDTEDLELMFLHVLGVNKLSGRMFERADVYEGDGVVDIRDMVYLCMLIKE